MLTCRVPPAFFEPDLEMEFVIFYLSLVLYRPRRKTLLEYKSRYAKDGHLFALFWLKSGVSQSWEFRSFVFIVTICLMQFPTAHMVSLEMVGLPGGFDWVWIGIRMILQKSFIIHYPAGLMIVTQDVCQCLTWTFANCQFPWWTQWGCCGGGQYCKCCS
jgi:hypothetical protein